MIPFIYFLNIFLFYLKGGMHMSYVNDAKMTAAMI